MGKWGLALFQPVVTQAALGVIGPDPHLPSGATHGGSHCQAEQGREGMPARGDGTQQVLPGWDSFSEVPTVRVTLAELICPFGPSMVVMWPEGLGRTGFLSLPP